MTRLTYAELGDSCMTAHAMELLGARWTYPIYRELVLGPKRFGDLLVSVRGVTPAVLTSRLREMDQSGLVRTHPLPAPTAGRAYALTPWALELAPVLREVGRWATRSPVRPDQGGLTPDAVVQAMLTMAGDHPLDPRLTVDLRLVDSRVGGAVETPYAVEWGDAGLTARRGPSLAPQVTIRSDSTRWGQILFETADLADAGAESDGDAGVADRLVTEFRTVVSAA